MFRDMSQMEKPPKPTPPKQKTFDQRVSFHSLEPVTEYYLKNLGLKGKQGMWGNDEYFSC